MECLTTREPIKTATRERRAFFFAVEGDIRFISHRDTMRMFERALARSALPVRFTEGFNPHARISLPLPRPVGVASLAEAVVVEFVEAVDDSSAMRALSEQMPAGIRLTGVQRLAVGRRLQPEKATYELVLPNPADPALHDRVAEMLAAGELTVDRLDANQVPARSIDVRPYVEDIRADGDTVTFTLRITGAGTARPAEIARLLGLDGAAINHLICRTAVSWTGADDPTGASHVNQSTTRFADPMMNSCDGRPRSEKEPYD